MKNSSGLGVVVAAVCGAAIWGFSPYFTGKFEPWDAEGLYYWVALFGAGVLVGWLEPRKPLTASLWVVGGQVFYILYTVLFNGKDIGLLIPMGILALLLLSAPCYIGAFLGAKLVRNAG